MPTFCRHNRFIERCPICSKTLPGAESAKRSSGAAARQRAGDGGGTARTRSPGARTNGLRVRHEGRAADDGYRCTLVPGLRSSLDALRLIDEVGFCSGRLLDLAIAPPGLYAQARALAGEDLEEATWICFLTAYLCPLEGDDPFAGVRLALRPDRDELGARELAEVPLGPRASHDPARGATTLEAYRRWVAQAGSQQLAFEGDSSWTVERRFERLFERLALPGLDRAARYELLVMLGRMGLYELQPASLQFSAPRAGLGEDRATGGAKRVFAIGDAIHLERRAAALAEALAVPLETLDLALANWHVGERATLGFSPDTNDSAARQRAFDALGL